MSFFTTQAQYQRNYYLNQGKREFSQHHYSEAIQQFTDALKFEPHLYEAYFLRGMSKLQVMDYAGAEEDFSQAISIFPYDPDFYLYRAVVRSRQYHFPEAFADFDRAIYYDDARPEIYLNRAVTYLTLHQYELAIEDCQKALEHKIQDDNVYLISGSAKVELQKYHEAIKDYNQALQMNPTDITAYLYRGIAFMKIPQKDSALTDFQYVITHDSTNAQGYFYRGLLKMQDEHFKDALADFDTSVALSPYNSTTFFNRAIAKTNLENYASAIADYDTVIELSPKNILAYYNRAGVKYKKHNLKGALEDYNKSIELYPEFSDAYFNRSLVKKALNDHKGAQADYQKAQALQKEDDSKRSQVELNKAVKFLQLTNFNDDFYGGSTITTKNDDIQLKSIFWLTFHPSDFQNIRAYDTYQQKYGGTGEIALVNQDDSVSENLITNRIEAISVQIQANPNNSVLFLKRGLLYSQNSFYNQAFTDFDKALQLDSTNFLAWFSRANTRLKLLKLMMTMQNGSPEIAGMKNREPSSNKNYQDHLYKQIRTDYDNALSLEPKFSFGWFNKAYAEALCQDYNAANYDFSRCIKTNSSLSEAYFNRGLIAIFFQDDMDGCSDLSKAGDLGLQEVYNIIKWHCYR